MEISNLKVTLLPHTPFLREDGKFDLKKAMNYQGKIGGICYNEEGLMASFNESLENTEKRVERTTSGEHQSVFEHVNIGLYLENSPKFLNMILNNEHQYSTSERSLRYTTVGEDDGLPIEMVELYNKWNHIFFDEIKKVYGNCKTDKEIMKLAQENSRYLMPVTMSTEMVHTIPLAQLNRVVNYMMEYKNNGLNGEKDNLHEQMVPHIDKFVEELYNANVIDERLQSNRKHRRLSIFGENLADKTIEYGENYSTVYIGTYAQYAQSHRHRTIYYQMERLLTPEYYIPPIIKNNDLLASKWLLDINTVYDMYGFIPQGEMVLISEKGTYDNFKMKMKERLCSAAQLEVAEQTEVTRDEYLKELFIKSSPRFKTLFGENEATRYEELYNDLKKYTKGARCTFPDYDCPKDCKFKEGKTLVRKI